jgi:voltage-gated potassium channel
MTQTTWQKATEWPLTISALAFLAAYATPIINPDIPSRLERTCEVIVWATWVLFGLDFIVRVVLAEHRPRYILRHWLDVLIIALPLLRGLRLLRLASLLAVLNRHAASGPRGQVGLRRGRVIVAGVLRRVGRARRRTPQSGSQHF